MQTSARTGETLPMGILPGSAINSSAGYLITDIRESVLIYAQASGMEIYSNFLMLVGGGKTNESFANLAVHNLFSWKRVN